MFIRVKTADGELNIAISQISIFQPADGDNKGSMIELVDGSQYLVNESCRVLRKLIAEANAGPVVEGDA